MPGINDTLFMADSHRMSYGSTAFFYYAYSALSCKKMICGNFRESAGKILKLQDVDEMVFLKVLNLKGGMDGIEKELAEMKELATVADRFLISDVILAMEEAIVGQLSVGMCVGMLSWSAGTAVGGSRAKAGDG